MAWAKVTTTIGDHALDLLCDVFGDGKTSLRGGFGLSTRRCMAYTTPLELALESSVLLPFSLR